MERNVSFHTFNMKSIASHEDEGSAYSTPASVVSVMNNAKEAFPGVITAHQLARSLDVILKPFGFNRESTLLATSLCCDEVCRDMEDELRSLYGQCFTFGGIAGFPFGGVTAFGAYLHHIPKNGQCLIVYGSHVGIDYDGIIGKVNRRGHHGSGACCNTALASLEYVRAVKEGRQIATLPDPSDPIDAQQVFVDSALMRHSERLLNSPRSEVELPHVVHDCQFELLKRIIDKCKSDIPPGTKIALLGGVQVNTPEGTPEYFLPKRFDICNDKGEIMQDLLQSLINEGTKDIALVLRQKKLNDKMIKAKKGQLEVPICL